MGVSGSQKGRPANLNSMSFTQTATIGVECFIRSYKVHFDLDYRENEKYYRCLEVEVEGEMEVCTAGFEEQAVEYLSLTDDRLTWDKSLYTKIENRAIAAYLKSPENFTRIERSFIRAAEEEELAAIEDQAISRYMWSAKRSSV